MSVIHEHYFNHHQFLWKMRHLARCSYLRAALRRSYCSSTDQTPPTVAVIGSGPGGFYTAQQLLKGHPNIKVDIYDRLPVPFGLVRFGVAPDHPEVKNVINTFTQTANNKRCSFLGNVTVGKDISVSDLQKYYSAVVLSYGAEADRTLNIPGEDLHGVLSARKFVGWYNGLPEDKDLVPDLATETAAVIGQGNVALDVARILLTPMDLLRKTDIPEYSLEILSRSRVKRVVLIGRRGPLQVAFTIKELRELVKLPDSKPLLNPADYEELKPHIKDLARPRKRLTELLINTAETEPTPEERERQSKAKTEWQLRFLRSPLEILSAQDRVSGIRLGVNKLEGPVSEKQQCVLTSETEDLDCGLVFRSVGYKSVPIEGVPFDSGRAVIPNNKGRVQGANGLYCSGWVKRGPTGVILSTMTDGYETAKTILKDLKEGHLKVTANQEGHAQAMEYLTKKGIQTVSFDDWQKIDQAEIQTGSVLGKPREKIVDVEKMLHIAKS